MRHRWPFSVHRFLYVAVHERTKLRSLLIRKGLGEDINGSDCGGFCGDRKLGLVEVIPVWPGVTQTGEVSDSLELFAQRS